MVRIRRPDIDLSKRPHRPDFNKRPDVDLNKRPHRPDLDRPEGGGRRNDRDRPDFNWFEDPLEHHAPLGGGFEWSNPLVSQDPLTPDFNPYLLTQEQICENHPSNPGCNVPDGEFYNPDGDFFNPELSNPLRPSWDVEIVKGNCIIGLRFTPKWLWLNMPPFEIIYRDPNCKEDEEEEPEPEPDPDEPAPPPRPPKWPGGRPPNGTYVEVITDKVVHSAQPTSSRSSARCVHEWWTESKLAAVTGQLTHPDVIWDDRRYIDRGWGWAVYRLTDNRFLGHVRSVAVSIDPLVIVGNWMTTGIFQRYNPSSERLLFVRWILSKDASNYRENTEYIVSQTSAWAVSSRFHNVPGYGHQLWMLENHPNNTFIAHTRVEKAYESVQWAGIGRYRGVVEDIDDFLTGSYPPKILGVYSGSPPYPYSGGMGCLPAPKPPEPPPPPPPPPPPRKKPMDKKCCKQDDRLIRHLLAKIERIEKTLAAPQFYEVEGDRDTGKVHQRKAKELPKAPERLIYPKKRGDKAQMAIPNLLTLGEFLIRQIDRAMGAFPLKAKISDGDKSSDGNQAVEVEIESVADGIREALENVLETRSDVDVMQLMLHRNLLETGIVHHGGVKMESMIRAIVEYLDFKVAYKVKKIPYYFDPTAGVKRGKGFSSETDEQEEKPEAPDTNGELEKILPLLLRENYQKIRVMEWDDKEKRSHNDKIEEILRNVVIAAGAVGVEADPQKIEDLIRNARALIKLENLQQRSNVQAAMASGKLTRQNPE